MSSNKVVREIATQQVLQPDGSVFSSQSIIFPAAHADVLTPPKLLERYLKYIRQQTFSVIRPVSGPHGVQFRLLGTSISLLSFSFPELIRLEDGSEVRLMIVGGMMVQRHESSGAFSIIVDKCQEGVRVTVQLAHFCPMLLCTRQVTTWRKLFYSFTQAWVHELITMAYLTRLYSEVTGVKVRTVRKNVHLREGTPV